MDRLSDPVRFTDQTGELIAGGLAEYAPGWFAAEDLWYGYGRDSG